MSDCATDECCNHAAEGARCTGWTYVLREPRSKVNARKDSALSHPNPAAIEMRCHRPPRPARRGTPPNAAPNRANASIIPRAEASRIRAQRGSLLRAADAAHVTGCNGYAREDRDGAEVVQHSLARGSARRAIGAVSLGRPWREASHRVGTKSPEPTRPAPTPKISAGTTRAAARCFGLRTRPRAAMQYSAPVSTEAVRCNQPARRPRGSSPRSAAGRTPRTARPNRREANHEQRPCGHSARKLERSRRRLDPRRHDRNRYRPLSLGAMRRRERWSLMTLGSGGHAAPDRGGHSSQRCSPRVRLTLWWQARIRFGRNLAGRRRSETGAGRRASRR